jgi:hypothetical protein
LDEGDLDEFGEVVDSDEEDPDEIFGGDSLDDVVEF